MSDLLAMTNLPWIKIAAWAMGEFIVFLFARNYFDGESYYFEKMEPENSGKSNLDFSAPVPPKLATNRASYSFWFWIFVGITTVVYVIISTIVDGLQPKELEEIVGANGGQLSVKVYLAFPQILSALLLTGLLPGLPVASDFLKSVRSYLHRRARIPDKAQGTYNYIVLDKLQITSDARARAISHGQGTVQSEDFETHIDSDRHRWAKICHLLATLKVFIENDEAYRGNAALPELRRTLVESNFKKTRTEIQNTDREHALPAMQIYVIEKLLKQVCQLTVCLIYCSEDRDDDVNQRLREIGVPKTYGGGYKIILSPIFISALVFFILIFFTSLALQSLLDFFGIATGKALEGGVGLTISTGATILVFYPIVFVFLGKILLSRFGHWPVRGKFSERQYWAQVVSMMAFAGSGVVVMFLFYQVGLYERQQDWARTLIYALIPGASGWLATAAIDRKFRMEARYNRVLRSAFLWAAIGAATFFCVGVVSVAVHMNLSLPIERIYEKPFAIWIVSLILIEGVVAGFIVSILVDKCIKPKGTRDFLQVIVREYLMPIFQADTLRDMSSTDLNGTLREHIDEFPSNFLAFLQS